MLPLASLLADLMSLKTIDSSDALSIVQPQNEQTRGLSLQDRLDVVSVKTDADLQRAVEFLGLRREQRDVAGGELREVGDVIWGIGERVGRRV
ncbi:hypothetical protein RUND412_003056 [Rhizina undulata]